MKKRNQDFGKDSYNSTFAGPVIQYTHLKDEIGVIFKRKLINRCFVCPRNVEF